jgi:hypothetical protein
MLEKVIAIVNDMIEYKSSLATFAGKAIHFGKRKKVLDKNHSHDEVVKEMSIWLANVNVL